MSNKLQRLKELKFLVGELKKDIADEYQLKETLQIMSTICLQIKREKNIGREEGYL